jgi:hypothetical protein
MNEYDLLPTIRYGHVYRFVLSDPDLSKQNYISIVIFDLEELRNAAILVSKSQVRVEVSRVCQVIV